LKESSSASSGLLLCIRLCSESFVHVCLQLSRHCEINYIDLLIFFLMSGDATTTICHRYTPRDQVRLFTQNADILVVATGIPGLITADMVKCDAAVIDVGFNEVHDVETGRWRVIGDVDFNGNYFAVCETTTSHHSAPVLVG